MGSFLTRCGVSGKTIMEGERCYLVALHEKPTNSVVVKGQWGAISARRIDSGSISRGQWHLLSGFMLVEAEDCGRFELVENPQNIQNFLTLAQRLANSKLEAADGQDSFIMPDATGYDTAQAMALWSEVQEASTDGLLYHEDKIDLRGSYCSVKFAVICESAFQELQKIGDESIVHLSESIRDASIDGVIGALTSEMPTESIHALIQHTLASSLMDALNMREVMLRTGIIDVYGGILSKAGAEAATAILASRPGNPDERSIPEAVIDQYLLGIEPFIVQAHAFMGLSEARISLRPFESAGQDYDNAQGHLFARIVNAAMAEAAPDEAPSFRPD